MREVSFQVEWSPPDGSPGQVTRVTLVAEVEDETDARETGAWFQRVSMALGVGFDESLRKQLEANARKR